MKKFQSLGVAHDIAADLFTNGNGTTAAHLHLIAGDGTYLGGWAFAAARSRIESILLRAFDESGAKEVTFDRFWDERSAWSLRQFGPVERRGPLGPSRHLLKELEGEIIPDLEAGRPVDKVEIVDCLHLVCDMAMRAGMTREEFLRVAFEKLRVNEARAWPETSGDMPVEHVRD